MSCSNQSRNKCMTQRACLSCCLNCSILCSVRCEISERNNLRKGLSLTNQFVKPCLKYEFNIPYANSKGKYTTITRKEIIEQHTKAHNLYDKRNELFRKLEENQKEISLGVFEELTQEDKDKLNADIDKVAKEIRVFFSQLKQKTKIPNILKLDIAFLILAHNNLKYDNDTITLRIDD